MATEEAKRGVTFKKEKEIYQGIDSQIKELNQTFREQSKCLDDRAGTQMAVLEMAHDFLRKWADIESEHSQKMEKLVKSFANKDKSGNNGSVSISVCLLGLFSTCGKLSKMYQQLADTITSQVVERLQVAREESQMVRKQCTPILEQCQDGVRRAVQEVLNTIKPYHTASSGFSAADQQFRDTQVELNKVSGVSTSNLNGSAKTGQNSFDQASKPMLKKQASVERKFAEKHAKREKLLSQVNEERNRHVLSLCVANSSLSCYNTEILPKYIKAMDHCARPAMCLALSCLAKFMETAERSVVGAGDELKSAVTRCQAENDIALMALVAPKLFVSGSRSQQGSIRDANSVFRFQPLRSDEPGELVLPPAVRDTRRLALNNMNLDNSKKLTAIVADLDRWEQIRWATSSSLADSGLGLGPQPSSPPGTIENYAQTLKQYSEIADQIARNEFELSLLNSSVPAGSGSYSAINSSFSSPQRGFLHSTSVENGGSASSMRPSGDHLISSSSVGSSSSGDNINNASRTPVFGGSIEDHLNRVGLSQSFNESVRSISATPNQIAHTPGSVSIASLSSTSSPPHPPLPPVVVSCVIYLSKYGLRQQGVFRINGSQIEISELKSKFERCENPLAAVDNPSSVNAAASVLKSYFRQLREPLLLPSTVTFDQWIGVATAPQGMVEAIRLIIAKLPSQIRTVAAFLFAFLNRVQEISAENMMDAYNLAVCFAPCLLPTPTESDQMQHFNALAAIIKTMILHVHSIFREDDVRLYDDVVNGKQDQTIKPQPEPQHQHQSQQPQHQTLQKFVRKPSVTSAEVPEAFVGGTVNAAGTVDSGVTSLTRQFRTLGNADTSTSSSSTITNKATTETGAGPMLPDDCEAMFNFTARNAHEMSLRRGDRMRIVRKLSEQWWEVTMGGRGGLVPANYLRLLTPAPSPAITSTSSIQSTSSSGSQTQGARLRTGVVSSVLPDATANVATSEQTNPHSTSTLPSNGHGSLLTRQGSAANGSIKANGQEVPPRRVFNNETNEVVNNNNNRPTINISSGDGHTAVNGNPLWMLRQVSTSATNGSVEARKSDSGVVMATNTVIEATVGAKSNLS